MKHWLYDTLGAKWHWFRYEYQGRGSIHCHGTAKLNNDPGLCQLTQTALKGFLAQKCRDENDCPDTTELDQDIEAGQNAADTVCQYVDWLLSTVNPNPPDEDTWIRPETHPCQRNHHDIPEHEKQSDYVDLLNMVQRHTCCSMSYCLRKKSNETELKCRFHFPFHHCSQTKLEFEKIHTSGDNEHYRAKIVTKRNDSRLNNHQHLQLQGWRANCDIQVVIDHYACVEYLTKYAAKGEPRSPILKQAFNSIVQNVDSSTDPRRAIKRVVMKSLGERDYAAQETMHHLLSLKLHSSSFKVMPVSLNGSRRVCDTANIEEGESCTDYSLLDVYSNREQYESSQNIINMNFVQFATTYKVVNNELTKLPENVIPRIFPTYSPNPKGPNFGLYCKYQLLRYKPWISIINTYRNPARLFIVGGGELRSQEGTTQGDPLAMPFYAISVMVLISFLHDAYDMVKQVWFADDSTAAGKLHALLAFFEMLISEGVKYGYHVNSGKSWLVIKDPCDIERATELFKSHDIKITSDGHRLLGAVIGSTCFREEYVNSKVSTWCTELENLCSIAKSQPHAAYAAFVQGYKHKFTFYIRTIPNVAHLFQPVEEIICSKFLPTIFGQDISQLDRETYALPIRNGGLGIPRIPEDADFERNTSKLLCAPLSALIIIQACNQLPQDDAITKVKSQVRSLRAERATTSSLSVDIQLSQEQHRTISLARVKKLINNS